MISKNLEKEILQTIKDKHLTPKPRWQFLLKNYVVWGLVVLSIFIGSLAFAVVLYMVINNDWNVYEYINDSFLGFIFVTLPYFWIILLGAFIIIAHYNLRHTKKGYRYSLNAIAFISIIGSIVLGTLFYKVGLGQAIDDVFVERVPFYQKFLGDRHKRWASPQDGLLAGVIAEVHKDNTLSLQDRTNTIWRVNIDEACMFQDIVFTEGLFIKIIGERETSTSTFKALRIIPGKPGPGLHRLRPHRPPSNFFHNTSDNFPERKFFLERTK